MKKLFFIIINCSLLIIHCSGQPLVPKKGFTHQDTLRGSIGPGRVWWDVTRYDIWVKPDYKTKSIVAINTISFKWLTAATAGYMQIDLQQPLKIDSIIYQGHSLSFERDTNVWFVKWLNIDHPVEEKITVYYHGTPREAVNPPWDGGWIWTKDDKGRPWMTVACQGLGASVWYPCKDHQSDEPDNGITLSIAVPDSLIAIGNGRLKDKKIKDHIATWTWEVKNPINNYDIIPYIGKYVNFTDTLNGEKGKLDLSYWVMDYNLEKAKKQFGEDVKPMLHCFEYWFGPYPFYEDSYKLVETSHLGMEHQSAVAYGNKYLKGYLGSDLSGTGWGLKWDYIIVHESGHEWFGNNITTNDIADSWVQEGITCYSETLFTECQYGKDAANQYTQGSRRGIRNTSPVIGPYGVNQDGSSDMYSKGNSLMHTIRQIINNDEKFREILRGLTSTFYHKTVDSKDIENYISKKSGIDFSKVFDQYLRKSNLPVLEYKMQGDNLSYHWVNCIAGFDMPVRLAVSDEWLKPTTDWKSTAVTAELQKDFQVNKNFYIIVKKVD